MNLTASVKLVVTWIINTRLTTIGTVQKKTMITSLTIEYSGYYCNLVITSFLVFGLPMQYSAHSIILLCLLANIYNIIVNLILQIGEAYKICDLIERKEKNN